MRLKNITFVLLIFILCTLLSSCSIKNSFIEASDIKEKNTITDVTQITYYDMSNESINLSQYKNIFVVLEDSYTGNGKYVMSADLYKSIIALSKTTGTLYSEAKDQLKEKYPLYCCNSETDLIIKFGYLVINQENKIGLLINNSIKVFSGEWQNIDKILYNLSFYS